MGLGGFDLGSFALTGRVAIVTGGNTGLGQAYSVALARAGADVFVPSLAPTTARPLPWWPQPAGGLST